MAYAIEPKSVKDFINMDTCLPRFQRKQTWNNEDNFKLCISVFKNYPVGVVIVNNDGEKNWLLDGRQRLNALKKLNENPVEVYLWAKKFVGFKPGDDEQRIKELYNKKIGEYLQKNYEENIYDEEVQNDDDNSSENDQMIITSEDECEKEINETSMEPTFNAKDQREGLNVLLNLILMVHNISSGKSKWERMFDFRKMINDLEYYEIVEGKETFSSRKLIMLMEKIQQEVKSATPSGEVTIDAIIKYFEDNRYFSRDSEKSKNAFRLKLEENWDGIKNSFSVVFNVKKILEDSRIGMIVLTSATGLDAQNIFSLVNSGGTKLTAEELLSAKPYWNIPVRNTSNLTNQVVNNLYEQLNVVKEPNVVRWDLCATLIQRIDSRNLIFKKVDNKNDLATYTTLGFKLISAIFIGGISSVSVSEIEKSEKTLDWNTEYEGFVTDLNHLCSIIYDIDYFKCMLDWNVSIMSITSNTIALEFLTVLYNYWNSKGKPMVESSELRSLRRNAVILFDKLIYEYSTKLWRGSSDSKLANDIKEKENRFSPISQDNWSIILKETSFGKINGQEAGQKIISPILYHSKFLALEYPSNSNEKDFEIDHIYPQAKFNNNENVDSSLKDSLCNLEILSKASNESKKDKDLNNIMFDESVKNEVSKSSYIDPQDFVKYSDISNFESLRKYRLAKFENIFNEKRNKRINN